MPLFGRRKREREARERVAAFWAARAEETRLRGVRSAEWRAEGPVTPERIRAEYEARRAALPGEVAGLARPTAARVLRDGEPRVDSSHMGGAPALFPEEPWPEPDHPMRFWAQVNLADLALFAEAFGVDMPGGGLLQIFAGDGGGQFVRHVPAADLARMELRRDIPRGSDWFDDEEGARIEATSLLIELFPEAVVGDKSSPPPPTPTPDDLPGYCLGWGPYFAEDDPDVTFLAVCNSNRDLGLAYSDEGVLWATVPTADLAAGDFSRLRCEGESS
jgi:hypothetical protein